MSEVLSDQTESTYHEKFSSAEHEIELAISEIAEKYDLDYIAVGQILKDLKMRKY